MPSIALGEKNGCTFGALNAPAKVFESGREQRKSLRAQPVEVKSRPSFIPCSGKHRYYEAIAMLPFLVAT